MFPRRLDSLHTSAGPGIPWNRSPIPGHASPPEATEIRPDEQRFQEKPPPVTRRFSATFPPAPTGKVPCTRDRNAVSPELPGAMHLS